MTSAYISLAMTVCCGCQGLLLENPEEGKWLQSWLWGVSATLPSPLYSFSLALTSFRPLFTSSIYMSSLQCLPLIWEASISLCHSWPGLKCTGQRGPRWESQAASQCSPNHTSRSMPSSMVPRTVAELICRRQCWGTSVTCLPASLCPGVGGLATS